MSRFLRFPFGKTKAFTLSYDDCNAGIIRLVKTMQKYNIKGTFNLNSGLYGQNCFGAECETSLNEQQLKDCLINSGMEIAIHGYKHLNPTSLNGLELFNEFATDKQNLENDFGGIVRGSAYAFGGVNEQTVSVLKTLDIAYARTIRSSNAFDLPSDWLMLDPTCHHNSPDLERLTNAFINANPDNGGGRKHPLLFYVWGHANEFDIKNNWQVIENLCERISNCEEVWCATNIEIYDYIKAFNSLHFSADGKTVQNNTAFDLWFYTDGQVKIAKKCSMTKL